MGITGFIGEVLNVGVIDHRSRATRDAQRTRTEQTQHITPRTRSAQRAFGLLAALGLCALGGVAPAAAAPAGTGGDEAATSPVNTGWGLDSTSECQFGGKNLKGMPWSLQRVLLDQLWSEAMGEGVKVAVIDTGVDKGNKQIAPALTSGGEDFVGSSNGTKDINGHGTRVAGIVAARPMKGTGFSGIAPRADIIPLRYTGGEGEKGKGDANTMAAAIKHAASQGADIINISSDTVKKESHPGLQAAVQSAVAKDILVVAAAGNDGADGKSENTFPASYDGVMAVASSDRNNERAFFSQQGEFVDVAAPGVGMVSTVPKGGQCSADGTSFSAPYVAGVAALMMEKYPEWTAQQVAARMAQTANRPGTGPDKKLGWGVVDPLAALSGDDKPQEEPTPDAGKQDVNKVTPMKLTVGESPEQRNQRISVYVVATGTVLTLLICGSALATRDYRRKQAGSTDAAVATPSRR